MAKHRIEISEELYSDIFEYCKLNGLKIGPFINDLLVKQFAIEQYGDTPFATYETTIINNNPVSSITIETVIEVPQEKLDVIKNSKEVYGEITHPSVVWAPYAIEENSPLVTNIDGNINEKYANKKVPSEYYETITVEQVEKAAEETQKQTSKPKKRRL